KDALQGTWRLVSLELNKQVYPAKDLKDGDKPLVVKLVIKGDGYSCDVGKNRLEITYKLDPAKQPGAIDLTVTEGPEKGKTYHGIYKVQGDTYTICRNVKPGQDRPTEFGTRTGSGLMMTVWKREKLTSASAPG